MSLGGALNNNLNTRGFKLGLEAQEPGNEE